MLKKHVFLTEKIPFEEMRKEYSEADVFIMPSIRETTGSVVLEAMSHALPVVTVNAFGASTIIDEECGWLYAGTSRDNYIENLKKILQACIENPKAVHEKGKNAYSRAQTYLWKKKIIKYWQIYRQI